MICVVALIVFALLGLVSAKYRNYFFEAFDCVTKRVTLRKCTTSFDKKMKMKITTKLVRFNKPFGGFVFKNFELISWIITFFMIASLIWSAWIGFSGLYNWYYYGNCYGPESSDLCALNNLIGASPAVIEGCMNPNCTGVDCEVHNMDYCIGSSCGCTQGDCISN
ncbi:MAG: hypothetical protein PHD80_02150 [Candidatus ainarchaeum sp.]|nr:hypothetical protein [Candidatus ainarchaeum sp.]